MGGLLRLWSEAGGPGRASLVGGLLAVITGILYVAAALIGLLPGIPGFGGAEAGTPTAISTATSRPLASPSLEPTSPAAVPSITILAPRDGDLVSVRERVLGGSDNISPGRVPDMPPPWIYVVVLQLAGSGSNRDWWVQPHPRIEDDGGWETFLALDVLSDPGTVFETCAIVTAEQLRVGRYGTVSPRWETRECVTVFTQP